MSCALINYYIHINMKKKRRKEKRKPKIAYISWEKTVESFNICQQMITRSQRQKSSNWPLAFRSS